MVSCIPTHAVTPERASDFRTSTASLSTHWPERSFSDKWERADTTSLCEDVPLPLGGFGSASQPVVPWPELRKGKRKKSGIMGGRLRRSTGSKRGSITSVGEWRIIRLTAVHGLLCSYNVGAPDLLDCTTRQFICDGVVSIVNVW